jgi:GAF domain-containing protein
MRPMPERLLRRRVPRARVWCLRSAGNPARVTAPSNHDLAFRMADLARTLARERTLDAVLAEVTSAAVELIPGVDTAGILLVKKGSGFESLATTSELPRQLDILQMTFDEGPCVQAALADTIVRTDDFRTETRWPQYSPAVVEIGVLSGLSFKLYTGDRTAGALNVFGFQPKQWEADDESVGCVLAAHAAAAIIATQQEQQLKAALLTRDRIGQAKGIIMERFHVDSVRAFEMLRQLSQEGNIKLVELADRVIDTAKG